VRFTFQLIRHNWLRFLGLSAIVAAPALLLASQEAIYPNAYLWTHPLALPLAAQIVAATLLTATITRMIVPDSAGHYPSLPKSIQAVLNDVFALVAIGLFSNVVILLNIFAPILVLNDLAPTADQIRKILVGVGLIALVLPGLFLTVLLAMLVPVRTIEQIDLVGTFVRGAELTRGNRWPIFGLIIATIMLEGVSEVAASIAINIVVGDPVLAGFSEETPGNGAAAILGAALVATAVSVVGATGTAVLYCELRRIKDGPAPRELASEFD
jgi:hypothetical protein